MFVCLYITRYKAKERKLLHIERWKVDCETEKGGKNHRVFYLYTSNFEGLIDGFIKKLESNNEKKSLKWKESWPQN